MQTWTNSQPMPRFRLTTPCAPSGNAVSHRTDPAKLLDVEMDEFAWVFPLIAADGFGLQCAELVEAQPVQNSTDGRSRDADFKSDLLAGPAMPAQLRDHLDTCLRRGLAKHMRPGRPVAKPSQAFTPVSIDPFADCPRANACGLRDGLRRLPALDLPYNSLSTVPRQPGILMNVHPILRESLKLRQPQSSRLGSDGQPMESSQLGRRLLRQPRQLRHHHGGARQALLRRSASRG